MQKQSLDKMLLTAEKHSLEPALSHIFGYHAVQIGNLQQNWLTTSPIRQKIYFSEENSPSIFHKNIVYGDYYQLPFIPGSIDLFVLAHSLESCSHPLTLLNEIHRSLRPEGKMIILNFNPRSLWGIVRRRPSINLTRMKKLLYIADFEIEEIKSVFFRPALTNQKLLQHLHFMEKIGKLLFPYHGAVYQIKAKKRTVSLTPIKPRWQTNHGLLPKGIAESSVNRKI